MKTLLSLLIVVSILLCGKAWAFADNELIKMSAIKSPGSVQIHFTFLKRPRFNTNVDKRRIDIQFATTKPAPDFLLSPPDDDIVKILSREFQDQLVLSFFFRYQPQDFRIDPSIKNTIIFNVTLGNEYSKSYNELAKRLKGLSIVDRNSVDFTNPYIQSPYSRNWSSFFNDFEPETDLFLPVTFTTPPFPVISLLPPGMAENSSLLDQEMLSLAAQGLWRQLAADISGKIYKNRNLEHQKMLALVYGEALARAGDFKPAYQQLYLLNERYNEEELAVYAMYWLNLLRAIEEDPLLAEYEFEKLSSLIPDASPLAPYYLLSRIETALAAKDYRRMNTLLQEDGIALPKEVESRILIRQADYWQAIDEPIKAYAAYNLLADSILIESQPHSYNNLCATLYAQGKFEEAASCYKKLATLVTNPADLGLVSYQEQMARLQFTPPLQLIGQFTQIETAYPGTEAQCLAEMKKNDLLLLRDPSQAGTLLDSYHNIAERCSQRSIRETARFKEILLKHQQGKNGEAIDMALDFLREFQSGDVRISAQALLIELVPDEIRRLVGEEHYVEALVLARQNRELFEKNWIDNTFLVDIAKAYQQLGLFDESQKLYLYLIEILPIDKREQFYPVMIEAALNSGNYSLLDDYASQYVYNYPQGKYINDILYLRLQALIVRNRLADALDLLPQPFPEQARFYRIKAEIMFQLDNYTDCLNTLYNLEINDTLTVTEQFMMAESLFKTGNYDRALLEYQKIPDNYEYHDQILYRQAEIARIEGKEEEAISLFKELTEKGKNSFWKELAERELQYDNIKDIF